MHEAFAAGDNKACFAAVAQWARYSDFIIKNLPNIKMSPNFEKKTDLKLILLYSLMWEKNNKDYMTENDMNFDTN